MKLDDSRRAPADGAAASGQAEAIRPPPAETFPIVGVGASAGGLEAFSRLLERLPADTGMALVFVQHLAAHHVSMLSELLSRTTAMPVVEVSHGTAVEPDRVYVIPPNTLMRIAGNTLELEPRPEERGAPRPIDHFLRSLAADRKANAIGVVLSGADSDGALGLQAIRAEGGIAIVQSESSAKHADMPRAAIAAGVVDLVLSPEEIASKLQRIGRRPMLAAPAGELSRDLRDKLQLDRIYALLGSAARVDFRKYRPETVLRRIERRMRLQGQESLASYAAYIEGERAELLALYEDILVHLTGFFEDPELFAAIQNEIVPDLLRGRTSQSPLRVWAPGCSTGEEVYSLAMCLVEALSKCPAPPAVQIFGTDINEKAIAAARAAIYPESEVAKLSPQRQARFFTRGENGYQIVKPVREMCVFARQNLLDDPPFSRLDLVSCRKVLIAFSPALQRHVIATFHYALQPRGYLMLSASESLPGFPELFSPAGKRRQFYKKKPARTPVSLELIGRGFASEQPRPEPFGAPDGNGEADLEKTAERVVMAEFGPAWVLVDEKLEILHSRGDTSPFLQLAGGAPAAGLLKQARESIRGGLRKVLAEAKKQDGAKRSAALPLSGAGEIREVRIEARRLSDPGGESASLLVLFLPGPANGTAPAPAPAPKGASRPSPAASAGLGRVRRELALTSQRLQSIIDERDAANQDLTSANEEIQSSNEELQSINEELETSKEELQSTNEELNTVNEELQNRNQELGRLSNDLANLLSSAAMPIVMLDGELRIRRITSAAERLLGLRPGDIGRPMGDIRMRLSVEDLQPMVRRVLETLTVEETELQDREGRWQVLRVRPYRTADNRIEGAVLVLVDIDQARRAQIGADVAREFAESVVESVQTPLLVLAADLRVRLANRAFLDCYGLEAAEVRERFFYQIGGDQWNLPGLRPALERLAAGEGAVENVEFEREFAALGRRTLSINARLVQPEGDNQILVVVEDITAHKRVERILLDERERLKRSVHDTGAALLRSREELRALTAQLLHTQEEERRRVSRELHDEMSQRMAKLQFDIETLHQQLPLDTEALRTRLLAIRDEVGSLSNDVRRIAYELHPSTLDHLGLSIALRSFSREFGQREGLEVRFQARRMPAKIPPQIASVLYRVAQEALRNVAKHAGKTTVSIMLAGGENRLRLSIRDEGAGFEMQRAGRKAGLGLISMQERVRLVNGKFSLKARPGAGVTIAIQVPLDGKDDIDATPAAAGG